MVDWKKAGKTAIWFSKKVSYFLDGFLWGLGFGVVFKLLGLHITIQ